MSVMYKKVMVDGNEVMYREAGEGNKRTILLLHGFPTSSHMFRNLIPLLQDRFHVIAPDLPGYGPKAPLRESFEYSFDHLKDVIYGLTEVLGLEKFSLYVFDYGAPVGFRLALEHPEKIEAIISQNGNVYEDGLGPDVQELVNADPKKRNSYAHMASYESIKQAYLNNDDEALIAPDSYNLDQFYMSMPGRGDIQLDLVLDYKNNAKLYPDFQKYLRDNQPKVLAVWGKGDTIFTPGGAEAFKRDVPDAEVHLLDAGHFALESHVEEIAAYIRDFFEKF